MGCFRRSRRRMNRPLISHRSPSPNCQCSCHRLERKVVAACEPSTLGSPTTLRKSPEKLRRARSLDRYPSMAMDITYVTERIIVVLFPRSEPDSTYRSNLKELIRMLRTKHGTKYMVFNFSERRRDLAKLSTQLLEFGWPPNLAPSLERLCSICKSIDSWMSSSAQNIAVLHSKDDRGRAGIVVASYMHYSDICASAHQSLDRFAMKQFFDDKLAPYIHPSQNRYIHYFSGLLSGEIHMNNNPMYLHRLVIHGVPNFDSKGGCKPFVKIYQGMQHIYSSDVFSATEKTKKIVMGFGSGLQIRGDMFIKCYHKSHRPMGRYPVFRIQFHTCTIDSDRITFERSDLDDANVDSRFPLNGRVDLYFSYRRDDFRGDASTQNISVPAGSSNDPLVRWDSYENFESIFQDNPVLDIFDADFVQDMESHPSDTTRRSNFYTQTIKHADQAELDELLNGMLKEIQSIPDTPMYHTLRPRYSQYPHTRTFTGITSITQDGDYAMPRGRSTGVVVVNGTKQYLTSEGSKSLPTGSRLGELYEEDEIGYVSSPLESLRQRHIMYDDSGRFHSEHSQSWLHRQQNKLKARREGRTWEDRHLKEQQLLAELRTTHHRKTVQNGGESTDDMSLGFDFSSSSREASPSKGSSYTLPLHVNTYNGYTSAPPTGSLKPPLCRNISAPSSPILPHRTSSKDITRNRYPLFQTQSKTIVRQKSDTSFDRERPFMAVKKSHQLTKDKISSKETSPQHVIAYGNIGSTHQSPGSANQGLLGVLTSADSKQNVPAHVKLDKLEQSLQELACPSVSPSHSPQDSQRSPLYFSQSTPRKTKYAADGPSWSPSMISSSPPSSPSRSDRPITPSFPVPPGTPYQDSTGSALPPRSPASSRKDRSPSPATIQKLQQDLIGPSQAHSSDGQSSPTVYFGQSRPSSLVLNESAEVIHHHPMFVKDTSKFWYKPNISREEAISILKDRPPGTFIVRDSNSFPGAYGLALKVASPPPNVQNKTGDISNELVRHFLIEPTSKGVRLKGCPNEPIFGSLSALVYQHSITNLALPSKLILPEQDIVYDAESDQNARNDALLEQGAACTVLYLGSLDIESLTGPQAVRKAFNEILAKSPLPTATPVHFKVSSQGITLNDNTHKLFFRRHYPVKSVSHCGLDPDGRRWTQVNEDGVPISSSYCFGFIARKPTSQTDNQCHLFAEFDPDQPATAIVNFVTKVMMVESQQSRSNMV